MNIYATYDEARIAYNQWRASFDEVIKAHRALPKPYRIKS